MPAELATTLTATTDDRLLQAESVVREFCGWHIAPTHVETLTVTGSGAARLILPTLHITDLTSVTDDGIALNVADIKGWEYGVLTHPTDVWSTGLVVVELEHGFTSPPPTVQGIVQAVAQRAVNNPGSAPRTQVGPFADTASQTGFNEAPALALLKSEKDTLRRFRATARS